MAAGKKKKKPAANPARGFATTSTVSKTQIDASDIEITITPKPPKTNREPKLDSASPKTVPSLPEKELHELTPEELEAQLEESDLQRVVEQYAARVRKEASRHATKLQTEKRLLRGQAGLLSTKEWLPDDLVTEILELNNQDATERHRHTLVGDDLLSKIWTLHECLTALEIPAENIELVTKHLITQPGTDNTIWSLSEALEWLALNVELVDYDTIQVRKREEQLEDEPVTDTNAHTSPDTIEDDGIIVSDLESDLEPEELMQKYVNTKERIFELDPGFEEPRRKDKPPQTKGKRKLHSRLQKIRSDMLFDLQGAEMQWSARKVILQKDAAERRRLRLDDTPVPTTAAPTGGTNIIEEAERIAREVLAEGDDDMLGGMFDALPTITAPTTNSGHVTIREMGKLTGLNPKRVLEEACKARDPKVAVTYRMISPTTYACRHSATIRWSREVDTSPISVQHIVLQQRRTTLTFEMSNVATTDIAQSEAYIATATLFSVFSESPKEAKAYLRLPPAFRDLWEEFEKQKQLATELRDREIVKRLRNMIDDNLPTAKDDEDDEIVYNPAQRKSNAPSGTATPTQQRALDTSSQLIDMWQARSSSPAFQAMLQVRSTLPMFSYRDAALDIIDQHQVSILCGETGCGKSTQLPAFILEHQLSQGRECKIYCTEPRRISAISLAQRVSEEMGDRKGDVGTNRSLVGYAIRLESQTSASTRLVYATVGIVLRMLENADGLKDITHLILDEVHERSIDTDFMLIILRSLMQRRPDLKVVLMSATVDAQRFSHYFDGAPIINVPGRTFPVQALYLEDAIELTGHIIEDNSRGDDEDDFESTANATGGDLSAYSKQTRSTLAKYDEYRIDYALIIRLLEFVAYNQAYTAFSKAILIFLPGIAEIRQLNDMLAGHPSFSRNWQVFPLHSSFSSEDQQAAFLVPPNGIRKIVLATNIAETGITIPDVTCVIDTGKHKEMRFDERRQMSRLIQSFIARANAKQRRGRAGRVQEGLCFHLFTKHRHDTMMIDQQTPEMLRLSLQDLVMRVKICKLGDIEGVLAQALDPPASKNVRRAIDALIEVDALTTSEELTPLGSQLAKLPVDAQLGKLLLLGSVYGCLDFALTVAATLSGKSPFLSPMHAKKQAETVRLGYKRGDSDLLTLYNAYITWRKICTTTGMHEHQFCSKNFLSSQNLGNIEDLKAQLLSSLAEAGFVTLGHEEKTVLAKLRHNQRHKHFLLLPAAYCRTDDNDEIANSVVAWSFYPKLLRRDGKGWRNIANNQSLGLHPTSVNKFTLSSDVQNLSFYSIMQTSARFTNAQETSPVSDYALVMGAGDAVFNLFAGVVIVDGNRLRYKVAGWRTMIVLKILRARFRECQSRMINSPGKELGTRLRRWMNLHQSILSRDHR